MMLSTVSLSESRNITIKCSFTVHIENEFLQQKICSKMTENCEIITLNMEGQVEMKSLFVSIKSVFLIFCSVFSNLE